MRAAHTWPGNGASLTVQGSRSLARGSAPTPSDSRLRPTVSLDSSLTPTLGLLLAAALGAGADASPQALRQLPGVGLRTLLGRPGGNPRSMSPQQLRTSQATTAWLTSIAMPAIAAPVFIPGVGGTAGV